MAIKYVKGQKTPPLPAGVYDAVIVEVADIGTSQSVFDPTKERHELYLGVEVVVPDTSKHRKMFKTMTLSFHPDSALTAFIETLFGDDTEEFDLDKLPGTPCQIGVVVKDEKSRIDAWYPAKDTSGVPAQDPVYFDLETLDEDAMSALPEWIQKKIEESNEWKARKRAEQDLKEFNDDIPDDLGGVSVDETEDVPA